MRIGVISDTHGLLRPEAEKTLRGVDLILHAGDVGDPQILERLKTIAPVFAVFAGMWIPNPGPRNCLKPPWCRRRALLSTCCITFARWTCARKLPDSRP